MSENIVNSNFDCDLCEFKAKSFRGLKTHIGHMHKVNERNTELVKCNEYERSAENEIGQTFCDLPTHLHHFYNFFHTIRINECVFFF